MAGTVLSARLQSASMSLTTSLGMHALLSFSFLGGRRVNCNRWTTACGPRQGRSGVQVLHCRTSDLISLSEQFQRAVGRMCKEPHAAMLRMSSRGLRCRVPGGPGMFRCVPEALRACIGISGFPEEAHDAISPAPHSGERGSDGGVGFGAASRGQGFDSVLAEAV